MHKITEEDVPENFKAPRLQKGVPNVLKKLKSPKIFQTTYKKK